MRGFRRTWRGGEGLDRVTQNEERSLDRGALSFFVVEERESVVGD